MAAVGKDSAESVSLLSFLVLKNVALLFRALLLPTHLHFAIFILCVSFPLYFYTLVAGRAPAREK